MRGTASRVVAVASAVTAVAIVLAAVAGTERND